jgi:hypothetical protein
MKVRVGVAGLLGRWALPIDKSCMSGSRSSVHAKACRFDDVISDIRVFNLRPVPVRRQYPGTSISPDPTSVSGDTSAFRVL